LNFSKDHKTLDPLELNIRLLRNIILTFIVIVSIKMVNEIIVQDMRGIVTCVILIASFSTSFFTNNRKYFKFACRYFMALLIIGLCSLTVLFGPGLGSNFGYFMAALMIPTFITNIKERFLWFGCIIAAYILSYYMLIGKTPIYADSLSEYSIHYLFIGSLIGIMAIAVNFIRTEQMLTENTKLLLQELKKKNINLQNSTAQIEEQNNQLKTANQSLEKFAYATSHDLKTPLRNINSFLGLMRKAMQKKEFDKVEEYHKISTESLNHMNNVIEKLLIHGAQFNSNNNKEWIDLNDIVSRIKKFIGPELKQKNFVINESPLPSIYADKNKIILVFQNLIENAIKYNDKDKPTISIYAKITENLCQIKFEDNGIGFDENYKDKIFEMFYRLNNNEEYKGTGIGLSTTKNIIEEMGGKITVSSAIDKGATFNLSFPKTKLKIQEKGEIIRSPLSKVASS